MLKQIMEEEQVLTDEYIPGEYIIQYDNKAIGMSGFSLQRMQTFTEKMPRLKDFIPAD